VNGLVHHLKNHGQKTILKLIASEPNPILAADRQLFLVVGDATQGPIEAIKSDEGVVLPGRLLDLQDRDFCLTIYHFNDIHAHLARFKQRGEEPVFTRMAHRIKETRLKVKDDPTWAVLTLSAGDDCIGSLFDELMDQTLEQKPVHASYHMFSIAGVDASVLGNHDFDLGVDVLAQSIRNDAKFPILAANLANCPVLDGLYYPAAIMVIKGVRVGIIGLVTSAETRINKDDDCIVNPIPVAQNLLAAIRPFCDVVIFLTHLGYSLETTLALTADAGDVELARSLPHGGVHLIVGGHSHDELNKGGLSPQNIVNGIPIVQAGSLGDYLGRVDLCIRKTSASVTQARLIATDSLPVDEDLDQAEMQPLIRRARNHFLMVLGQVEDDPHLSTDYVRNNFASGELELSNFINDGLGRQLRQAGKLLDLAMIDSSCVRQGLDVGGQLTFGDWFNLMPFADTVRFYQLRGSQLRDLIQDNALRVDRPDEPNTERGFLQFSSDVRYRIKLGSKREDAIAYDIYIHGQRIEEQLFRQFFVVSTSFVREMAGNWELCQEHRPDCELLNLNIFSYSETDYFLRDELVKYILEMGGVTRKAGAILDGRLQVVVED
jgi:5'-nucleotidase / UDP-sugar diphosphatase